MTRNRSPLAAVFAAVLTLAAIWPLTLSGPVQARTSSAAPITIATLA